MAPRKRKEPAPVTALDEQQTVEAAHAAELEANPVVDPAGEQQDEGVPLYPSTPPELVTDPAHQEPVQETARPAQEPHQGEHREHHPATARGHSERFHGRRSVDGHVVNGVKLNLIDDGNYGGMGVQIDVEQPSDKPTPDETAVLKDGGFRYKGGEWRAGIDRRDPAGSRNAHHATYGRFVDKFRGREGGEPER
ncbi:MAG TPA: hypothetical protein VD866_17385 [Urbifossiella sp.]|nr:hypothetical protein [Urbifossiella sp.]